MPRFVTCGPNEAIIVSGCCHSTPTIRAGGRVFVWHIFHKVQRLNLNTMTLRVESPKVFSDGGVPITVKGIAQVKIQGKNLDYLRAASEMFLDMTSDQISDIARVVLDGHQRSMVASMKIEELYKSGHEFSKNVHQNAQSDLIEMGLTLVSYTIQDITDDDGYLHALGQDRIINVQSDAKKDEANQNKLAELKTIEAEQQTKEKECQDSQRLSLRQLEFDIQRAELRKKIGEADARKLLTGQLQAAEENRSLVEQAMQVRLLEMQTQTELVMKQKILKQLELRHKVEIKADFECERELELARANKSKAIAETDMKAEQIRRISEAKATVIQKQRQADAEVVRENAIAFAHFNDTAKLELVLGVLPRLAAEVAGPIAECKKITSVSQEDGSVGFSRVTDEVLNIIERLCQSVNVMTSTTTPSAGPTFCGGAGAGPLSPTGSVASVASSRIKPSSRFGL